MSTARNNVNSDEFPMEEFVPTPEKPRETWDEREARVQRNKFAQAHPGLAKYRRDMAAKAAKTAKEAKT